ncbi:unnamed protein product [Ilex paraguariensis]|uniref:Uncharacterized protein n=1 Tax=Ilex paraguariensis TaxID=185542 RepID=A0ABC8TP00_9AQUA
MAADAKGDPSASKLLSPVGGLSFSSVGCQSEVDSPGSQFMFQPRGVQVTPSWSTDWRACTDTRSNAGFEVTGRKGHGAQQSLENGKLWADS